MLCERDRPCDCDSAPADGELLRELLWLISTGTLGEVDGPWAMDGPWAVVGGDEATGVAGPAIGGAVSRCGDVSGVAGCAKRARRRLRISSGLSSSISGQQLRLFRVSSRRRRRTRRKMGRTRRQHKEEEEAAASVQQRLMHPASSGHVGAE